jgi:hypothetical protein
MKIIQILISTWKGQQGDTMEDVVGLGDDGLLYKWHKSSGTWVLNIFNK